jgi:DNA-binding transcriptional MerR regulator
VGDRKVLTTNQLAQELGLSRRSIVRYAADGKITPAYTTPGGHHRWIADDVLRQLRELRHRD